MNCRILNKKPVEINKKRELEITPETKKEDKEIDKWFCNHVNQESGITLIINDLKYQ